MSKIKSIFVCGQCGVKSAKWVGRCPSCGAWNSYAEETELSGSVKKSISSGKMKLYNFHDTDESLPERILLKDNEFNRVLGGGLVKGSTVLIGGEPGIGKSTLLLQAALKTQDRKVLYISGEESFAQIRQRAGRLGLVNEQCHILTETEMELISSCINEIMPDIVIIDSIQTLYSSRMDNVPGTVGQIRECSAEISRIAREKSLAAFLIGHITKEGYIAGPKLLEHMVDTVLYFEGDNNLDYRILRTVKNRFGPISELGIYAMSQKGLEEISNPSQVLISHRTNNLSGIGISASLEGFRPILIEIQALVSPSHYGVPQRNSTGFDNRRMAMLIAVLDKRCGINILSQDVFLNIAGGLKVSDPANDLAVMVALSSSLYDKPVREKVCFAGEVGLSGEIRPARQLDRRVSEAEKMGFDKIMISSFNKNISKNKNIRILGFENVPALMEDLFF